MPTSIKSQFNDRDRRYADEIGKHAWDAGRVILGHQTLDIHRYEVTNANHALHRPGTKTDVGRLKIPCTVSDFVIEKEQGEVREVVFGTKRFIIYDFEARITDVLEYPASSSRSWRIQDVNWNEKSGRCEITASIKDEPAR